MMLIDEAYLPMGNDLKEVFRNKLKVVILEINDLKKEVSSTRAQNDDPGTLCSLIQTLDVEIIEIWNKLDLQLC